MLKRTIYLLAITLALVGTATATASEAQTPQENRRRILLTNDNGIDDPKLVALARAFARQAETWVVAPDRDRSGTGSHLTFPATGQLIAERRELGEGIEAFAVAGTPGDCVVLAATGLMAGNPPDLVISGINGGTNAGDEWLFSGTVGAARVAALGVPAVAVSGLDDDLPGAVEAAVNWVVRLASHEVVTGLRPGEYLTVSLPRIPPSEIRGIKIVDRAPGMPALRFASEDDTTWRIVGQTAPHSPMPADSDRAAIDAGFIAVVPMRLDEVDLDRLARWRRRDIQLPEWQSGSTHQP
jgi:5'-nucleotidase